MKKQDSENEFKQIDFSNLPLLSPEETLNLFNQTGVMLSRSKPSRIIAVDPGSTVSGFAVIENGQISFAANLPNQFVYSKIREFAQNSAHSIIIEDVRPYGTRLSTDLLDTTKFIGELQYRLIERVSPPVMISRFDVKKWVFDCFPAVAIEPVRIKMEKAGAVKEDGSPKAPHFMWVDDRIVVKAMKSLWNIPNPKPGKRCLHGLNTHSWQALAVGSCYMHKKGLR